MTPQDIDANEAAKLFEALRPRLVVFLRGRLWGRYSEEFLGGPVDSETPDDLVSEFYAKHPRALVEAVRWASSIEHAVHILEGKLFNFVKDVGRKGSQRANVFRRLVAALESDPRFCALGGSGFRAIYGLIGWQQDPRSLCSEEQLRVADRFLPSALQRVEYSSGSRMSPGIATSDLTRMAHDLLDGIGHPMTAPQIMGVIEKRFVIGVGRNEGDEIESFASESVGPLLQVVVDELARTIVNELTPLQRAILTIQGSALEHVSLTRLAAALKLAGFEVGRTTVDEEQKRIQWLFEAVRLTQADERAQVMHAVLALLTDPGEDAVPVTHFR